MLTAPRKSISIRLTHLIILCLLPSSTWYKTPQEGHQPGQADVGQRG